MVQRTHATLTALNTGAVTHRDYTYTDDDNTNKEWETSGNFIHSTQTIIDDCYPVSGKYKNHYTLPGGVPAHYWYIKGNVYVYDQYISAYTGLPSAYSEKVNIPLTITAASHGTMTLMRVEPNLYAYYSANGTTQKKLEPGSKMIINDVEYHLNDPINYWDWYMLSKADQKKFVRDTYVTIEECTLTGGTAKYPAGTTLPAGTVMLKEEYDDLRDSVTTVKQGDKDVAFDYIFRSSNNLSHDNGYILTYDVTNPDIWDQWYTPVSGSHTEKIKEAAYEQLSSNDQALYEDGPTYHPTISGLYGQQYYSAGDIISKKVYDTYQDVSAYLPSEAAVAADPSLAQAAFEEAYIVTEDVSVDANDFYKDAIIPESLYYANVATLSSYAKVAYTCSSTIQLSPTEYIYINTRMTEKDKEDYIASVNERISEAIGVSLERAKEITKASDLSAGEETRLTVQQKSTLRTLLSQKSDIETYIVPAYYCTKAGRYGGNHYDKDRNYRGLEAWSSMSAEDRANFEFNYDALDLLIDSTYSRLPNGAANTDYPEGKKYQYDSKEDKLAGAEANKAHYSLERPVDYTATYKGASSLVYYTDNDKTEANKKTVEPNAELTREKYELLPNEKRYYAPITVPAATKTYTVNTTFGNYTADQTITADAYAQLSDNDKAKVTVELVSNGKIYVVKESFHRGDTPYAVGSTITEETFLSLEPEEQLMVDELQFAASDEVQTYYYCRHAYTIGEHGEGVAVTDIKDEVHSVGSTVGIGVVISADNFRDLPNKQTDFVIHGTAPEETSTLYVARNSDINDLSTEKIITVIYKYDYEETDLSGNITPYSERHVLNIHLKFKSGVPTVEDITAPHIVLPGTTVSLREPFVTPGAYEVTGGGWELFATKEDADSHTNGIEYTPVAYPLYYYQDGYYTAYYAKSYLGKTYSNAVPVAVANYHDMKDVWTDKDHHMYIDHKKVQREPKIYINDYSRSTDGQDNGLVMFKDLIALSHIEQTLDGEGKPVALSGRGDALDGHVPLERAGSGATEKPMRGGQYLEFFLRADQSAPAVPSGSPDGTSAWTPIASGTGECFSGILHGDGHTVSGLDHSLFGHLCGDVFNLGVTGSFTSAGIADTGEGYVENCWVKSTATSLPPGATKVNAVFGTPGAASGTKQVVNSYFWDGNKDLYNTVQDNTVQGGSAALTSGGTNGTARAMTAQEFYNGTVTYNLNGFYLWKRYSDQQPGTSGTAYQYYTVQADNTLSAPQTKYYASDPAFCSSGYRPSPASAGYVVPMYVEDRFADGDFIYQGGTIPEDDDVRLADNGNYYPIWPDDYLFFGQTLTYGYYEDSRPHEQWPSAIYKSGGRLLSTTASNRVYRAPAYYRSNKMDFAHFNPAAVFAEKSADGAHLAFPHMTAIDFTGYSETGYSSGFTATAPYAGISSGKGAFYPPLLDDDGLLSFENKDLTGNLLVYIPQPTATATDAATKTNAVVTAYLQEPDFDQHLSQTDADPLGRYRTVAKNSEVTLRGHRVVKGDAGYAAPVDHFLVDKQDFNAPIAYTFQADKRMWYQRAPDNYVSLNTGWESISLPFAPTLVSTQTKGELTHFYGGSSESYNDTGTKHSHEYWLRGFTGMMIESDNLVKATDQQGNAIDDTYLANFQYPAATSADGFAAATQAVGDKTYTNTFLWDYYYQYGSAGRPDKNADIYQQQYYAGSHDLSGYVYQSAALPYLVGFPGRRYYEFDLSGNFLPQNTRHEVERLPMQTVTFASDDGITVGVSDLEQAAANSATTHDGYTFTFTSNYLGKELPAGTYVLNATGSQYQATDVTTTAVPFRPYFMVTPASSRKGTMARAIAFGNATGIRDHGSDPGNDQVDGDLLIYAKRGKIVVKSRRKTEAVVRILTTSGVSLTTFTIQPGEAIETPVHATGVYIANGKKLRVEGR